ncbi:MULTISPECIES: hypothetical protein [Streptomyces]|uniref:Uncharacterized protein n=1 Tax=Streptomyces pseudovenezuelae TaxID=67350 RepID=A0A101N9H0_9ACTN|nr:MULTISPECIES: hypothetical protein [Streptomyces]KUM89100.1 hypothetical protein AQI94_11265 [Streptomyces pseudovenezuelae]
MGAPKYVLLSYDRQADFGGEEGYEETWAWCEDAEGLFADPSPPLREVYDLLGCAPEGQLSEALTRRRAGGPVPLGSLTLEILDRTGRPARPTTSTAATSPTCPASSARWARR